MTLKIEDFKIGGEGEFINVPTRQVVEHVNSTTNVPFHLEGYNHNVPRGWKVTTDQTVSRNYSFSSGEGEGGEIVSPILRGQAGIDEVTTVFNSVNSLMGSYGSGNNINRECGYHVHLSWRGMTVEQCKKIFADWIVYEEEIDQFIPRSRRADNNRWCRSNKSSPSIARAVQNLRTQDLRGMGTWFERNASRYVKLNFCSLARQGTIEFRHHSGTTDPQKITNWIKFLINFVIASVNGRGASFDATQFRATDKKVFSDMRSALASQNWTLKSRQRYWDFIDDAGNVVATKTYDECLNFYDNRTSRFDITGKPTRNIRLNTSFSNFLTSIGFVSASSSSMGVYENQDQDTINYLEERKRRLA